MRENNKKLRCGYTTGLCAAAAAKAAAQMLLTGEEVNKVSIYAPAGKTITVETADVCIAPEYAKCAVKKDSGDDPDITNGILIYAKCEKIPYGIEIEGGIGVGVVTKSGLDQPVGAAAINSVPRKMISAAAAEICEKYDYTGGIKITISIPQGVELAKKTFNPRLGIVGGLSVIGTTGIVEPMSSSSLIETIRLEERVRRNEGADYLLLTIGNYSKSFVSNEMPYAIEKSVMCSNFIGKALDFAVELGFKGVLIVGHIGKLVKLGAGIMNTHSHEADGRMDVLVTCGLLADTDLQTLKKITECATVDAALEELEAVGKMREALDILMKKVSPYPDARVNGELKTGVLMFSDKLQIICKTEFADELIRCIEEEYGG